ncbi:MAG: Ig-like domain-containing protein [Ruminococcus sp.]
MKKLISLAMAVVMLTAMATVAITSASAETTATVNGKTANVGDKVTVTYYVSSDAKWEDFQGYATYDYTGLQLDAADMPSTPQGLMYNTMYKGFMYYCGTSFQDPYDLTTEKVFFTMEFTVLKAGNYEVQNTWEIIDDTNSVLIVGDGTYDEARISCRFETVVTPKPTTTTTTSTPKPTTSTPKPTTTASTPAPSTSTTWDSILVDKITLDKTATVLYTGRTTTLKATLTPDNATNKTVEWSSSNSGIATVTQSGVVKGVRSGVATITAKAVGGPVVATCKVTVRQSVQSITMNKKATVYTGQKVTLKVKVSPTNAYNKSMYWKSSNTKVATVTQTGVVKGVKKGTATVSATTKDGSKKTVKCVVTVNQAVTKITLNSTSVKLAKKGSTANVTATVAPKTAYNKNLAVKSSNKKVVKVNKSTIASGKAVKLTAVKKGSAKVTFTAKDGSKKSAVCKVTVKK